MNQNEIRSLRSIKSYHTTIYACMVKVLVTRNLKENESLEYTELLIVTVKAQRYSPSLEW